MKPRKTPSRYFAPFTASVAASLLLLSPAAPASDIISVEEAAEHWAFRLPVRPALPGKSANPIDAFIAEKHREHNLRPTRPAAPATLLRRLHIDLTGLPPTAAELREFLANPSPAVYEKIVDELLSSPRYGERWGRHWMDVWRYSEAFGKEGKDRITNGLPHLWRWRDWIVESLNEDVGYDRMILEMLAGDEIAPGDPDVLRATGFLVRNRFRLDRDIPLMAAVEHTSRAFLGLTLECARCHEHKEEPISHEDYYRFRAFFEPIDFRIDRLPGEPDTSVDGLARAYDATLDTPTYLFEKGDERRPVEDRPLAPGIPAFLESLFLEGESLPLKEVALAPEHYYPALRAHQVREDIEALETAIETLEASIKKQSGKAKIAAENSDAEGEAEAREKLAVAEKDLATRRARRTATLAVSEADEMKYSGAIAAQPASAAFEEISLAADAAQKAATIAATQESLFKTRKNLEELNAGDTKDPKIIGKIKAAKKELAGYETTLEETRAAKPTSAYKPLGKLYPEQSTGRRTALAQWLTGNRNPLTARVAVNHLWMRHFGEPLVPTIYDFGFIGKPPTHPELLDYLAVEFMENGWKMKPIHRLIVTSKTYRLASSNKDQDANIAIDSANQFLWRMNPQRMQAEAVRDAMLHIAGTLDPAMGGPSIPVKDEPTTPRRSLYLVHSGAERAPLLKLFDSAGVVECYRREESIVPQQALALSNGPLARRSSRQIAADLTASRAEESPFIAAAFERVLARPPSSKESAAAARFLKDQAGLLADTSKLEAFPGKQKSDPPPAADPAQRARESLVLVLFNHNDYVTVR